MGSSRRAQENLRRRDGANHHQAPKVFMSAKISISELLSYYGPSGHAPSFFTGCQDKLRAGDRQADVVWQQSGMLCPAPVIAPSAVARSIMNCGL